MFVSNHRVDFPRFPLGRFGPGSAIRFIFALSSFTLLATTATLAQDQSDDRDSSPRERVNRQFDAGAPRIGESLPDIAGLDEEGQEFRLSTLRGHHTVLVFGCLT